MPNETAVNLAMFVIGVALAIVTWVCYKQSLEFEPKKGEFGTIYAWTAALAIVTVVYWTELPVLLKAPPAMMSWARGVVGSAVNHFFSPSAAGTTGGASSAATPVPAGTPNDYIEWADKLNVHPKAGAASLNGWTVTVIPVDPAKVDQRKRVIGPTTVLDEPYQVYFDPDPSWGIRGTPAVPPTGRP